MGPLLRPPGLGVGVGHIQLLDLHLHRGPAGRAQQALQLLGTKVEPAGPQAQPLGIHHRDRAAALDQPPQPPGGHGNHRLGQVDPHGQPGRAGQAGRRNQDGAAAAGHIEHAHPLADARQGQQPLCDLVEEPRLVCQGRATRP
jgi:hypothetical protein